MTDAATAKPHLKDTPIHPLLGLRSSIGARVFETTFKPKEQWILNEHRILAGTSVAPGTAFIEMARAAFSIDHADDAVEFSDLLFVQPLIIPDGQVRTVQTSLHGDNGELTFSIRSRDASDPGSPWLDHAVGTIARTAVSASANGNSKRSPAALIPALTLVETPITAAQRDQIRRHGLGPRWATVKQVFAGPGDAIALIELPETYSGDLKYIGLHPALLDTAIGFANWHVGGDGTFLPVSYERLRLHAPLPARFYSHVRFAAGNRSPRDSTRYDVELFSDDGSLLVAIDGVIFRRVDASAMVAPASKSVECTADRRASHAPAGMKPQDAVEALRRIMLRGIVPQVIVSMRDPADVIADVGRIDAPHTLQHLDSLARPAASTAQARPDLRSEYVRPREGDESQLAVIWSELLGVDRVGRNDNFFELGGDSVIGIQMIAKAHHVGIRLTPQQLFRHQTIAALIQTIGHTAHSTPDNGAIQIVTTRDPAGDRIAQARLDTQTMQSLARQIEAADE